MPDAIAPDAPGADAPAPLFIAVPVAELPSGRKTVDPATLALGKAVLEIINADTAAQDAATYPEKTGAAERATAIRKAVKAAGPVADGHRVKTRLVSGADGYRVVVTLDKIAPKTDAPKRGASVAK